MATRICFRGDTRTPFAPDNMFANGFARRMVGAGPIQYRRLGANRAGDIEPSSAVCVSARLGGAAMWVPQGQRGVVAAGNAYGGTPGSPIRSNGMSWTAGAAYEFGPYKVGLDYMHGENNKTTGGGVDRLEQGVISGTYTLGPGIRLVGGIFYYDWQEENRMSENRNGIGGATGLKLAF